MDLFKQLFSDFEIQEILSENEELLYQDRDKILKILQLFQKISCSNVEIRNIIFTYPQLFFRDYEDLAELIDKLKSYEISNLNHVLDKYPFLLFHNAYEIDLFYAKKKKEMEFSEISKLLEERPYAIEE